jgi:hypothetical protein
MPELIVLGIIALIVFATMYYQSYRDKARWQRIASGMSLFGERENIPPLVLEGVTFEPHEKRVLLIWGDQKKTSFNTVSEAIRRIERARGSTKAQNARVFAWDGESWKQRR